MSEHTPGPWRVVNTPSASSLEVYAGDRPICEMYRRVDRVAEHATAALIAAAPMMRQALEAINGAACYGSEENPSVQREALLLIGMIARGALAKEEPPESILDKAQKERGA